jgi:hypothetical protein
MAYPGASAAGARNKSKSRIDLAPSAAIGY